MFVRLCGRSPKDGEPLDRWIWWQKYESELQKLIEEGYDATPNTKMIAISRVQYMKVHNGSEAMSLLLTSERVYAEMVDWLKYGEPEQICLRKWEAELSIDYEFRAFICEGTLTAISQYDHYTYYPYLETEADMLKKGIYELWVEVHPYVKINSYVLDVAYLKRSKKFMVVELSPFSPCTGPALFHWEADRIILEGGNLPLDGCSGLEQVTFR